MMVNDLQIHDFDWGGGGWGVDWVEYITSLSENYEQVPQHDMKRLLRNFFR